MSSQEGRRRCHAGLDNVVLRRLQGGAEVSLLVSRERLEFVRTYNLTLLNARRSSGISAKNRGAGDGLGEGGRELPLSGFGIAEVNK